MAIQTLTPGTLLNTQYPADTQTLLNAFAAALYAPTATREFFSQATSSGLSVSKDTIWYDESKKALRVYDSGWKSPIAGGKVTVTGTVNQDFSSVYISNYSAPFTPPNSSLLALTFPFRGASNKILLRASIPWVASDQANDIVIAFLKTGNTALGVSFTQVPAANAPVSLVVEALYSPGAQNVGDISFDVGIGSSTSGATVKVGLTSANANAWNPIVLSAEEVE